MTDHEDHDTEEEEGEDWAQGLHATCCGEPGSGPCCQTEEDAETSHPQ